MPLANTYADGYLAAIVTTERETRAATEVGQLGTFPPAWVARLTVLRAYVITCTESMKSPDDMFVAKLAAYRKEFDAALLQARAAQQAIDALSSTRGSGGGFFTIGIERG